MLSLAQLFLLFIPELQFMNKEILCICNCIMVIIFASQLVDLARFTSPATQNEFTRKQNCFLIWTDSGQAPFSVASFIFFSFNKKKPKTQCCITVSWILRVLNAYIFSGLFVHLFHLCATLLLCVISGVHLRLVFVWFVMLCSVCCVPLFCFALLCDAIVLLFIFSFSIWLFVSFWLVALCTCYSWAKILLPKLGWLVDSFVFADQRPVVVYLVIQNFKSLITSDPLGVIKSWVGSDVLLFYW